MSSSSSSTGQTNLPLFYLTDLKPYWTALNSPKKVLKSKSETTRDVAQVIFFTVGICSPKVFFNSKQKHLEHLTEAEKVFFLFKAIFVEKYNFLLSGNYQAAFKDEVEEKSGLSGKSTLEAYADEYKKFLRFYPMPVQLINIFRCQGFLNDFKNDFMDVSGPWAAEEIKYSSLVFSILEHHEDLPPPFEKEKIKLTQFIFSKAALCYFETTRSSKDYGKIKWLNWFSLIKEWFSKSSPEDQQRVKGFFDCLGINYFASSSEKNKSVYKEVEILSFREFLVQKTCKALLKSTKTVFFSKYINDGLQKIDEYSRKQILLLTTLYATTLKTPMPIWSTMSSPQIQTLGYFLDIKASKNRLELPSELFDKNISEKEWRILKESTRLATPGQISLVYNATKTLLNFLGTPNNKSLFYQIFVSLLKMRNILSFTLLVEKIFAKSKNNFLLSSGTEYDLFLLIKKSEGLSDFNWVRVRSNFTVIEKLAQSEQLKSFKFPIPATFWFEFLFIEDENEFQKIAIRFKESLVDEMIQDHLKNPFPMTEKVLLNAQTKGEIVSYYYHLFLEYLQQKLTFAQIRTLLKICYATLQNTRLLKINGSILDQMNAVRKNSTLISPPIKGSSFASHFERKEHELNREPAYSESSTAHFDFGLDGQDFFVSGSPVSVSAAVSGTMTPNPLPNAAASVTRFHNSVSSSTSSDSNPNFTNIVPSASYNPHDTEYEREFRLSHFTAPAAINPSNNTVQENTEAFISKTPIPDPSSQRMRTRRPSLIQVAEEVEAEAISTFLDSGFSSGEPLATTQNYQNYQSTLRTFTPAPTVTRRSSLQGVSEKEAEAITSISEISVIIERSDISSCSARKEVATAQSDQSAHRSTPSANPEPSKLRSQKNRREKSKSISSFSDMTPTGMTPTGSQKISPSLNRPTPQLCLSTISTIATSAPLSYIFNQLNLIDILLNSNRTKENMSSCLELIKTIWNEFDLTEMEMATILFDYLPPPIEGETINLKEANALRISLQESQTLLNIQLELIRLIEKIVNHKLPSIAVYGWLLYAPQAEDVIGVIKGLITDSNNLDYYYKIPNEENQKDIQRSPANLIRCNVKKKMEKGNIARLKSTPKVGIPCTSYEDSFSEALGIIRNDLCLAIAPPSFQPLSAFLQFDAMDTNSFDHGYMTRGLTLMNKKSHQGIAIYRDWEIPSESTEHPVFTVSLVNIERKQACILQITLPWSWENLAKNKGANMKLLHDIAVQFGEENETTSRIESPRHDFIEVLKRYYHYSLRWLAHQERNKMEFTPDLLNLDIKNLNIKKLKISFGYSFFSEKEAQNYRIDIYRETLPPAINAIILRMITIVKDNQPTEQKFFFSLEGTANSEIEKISDRRGSTCDPLDHILFRFTPEKSNRNGTMVVNEICLSIDNVSREVMYCDLINNKSFPDLLRWQVLMVMTKILYHTNKPPRLSVYSHLHSLTSPGGHPRSASPE